MPNKKIDKRVVKEQQSIRSKKEQVWIKIIGTQEQAEKKDVENHTIVF